MMSKTDTAHSRPVLLISLLEAVRKFDDYGKTKGPGSQKITINKAKKLLLEVPRQTLIPCNFCLYEGNKVEPCDYCPARMKEDAE